MDDETFLNEIVKDMPAQGPKSLCTRMSQFDTMGAQTLEELNQHDFVEFSADWNRRVQVVKSTFAAAITACKDLIAHLKARDAQEVRDRKKAELDKTKEELKRVRDEAKKAVDAITKRVTEVKESPPSSYTSGTVCQMCWATHCPKTAEAFRASSQ